MASEGLDPIGSVGPSPRIRLASQAAVYAAAGLVGKVAGLITVPYLTRQLSPDGYGLADLATSFAALVAVLVRFGGEVPAARMRAHARDDAERRTLMGTYVGVSVLLAVIAALVLLPFARDISSVLWASPDNAFLAAITLLLIPLTAAEATLASVLRLESRSRAFARVAIVDLVAKLLFVVGFVAMGHGPAGVVGGFLVGSTIGTAFAGWEARGLVAMRVEAGLARSLVSQGLPFLPALVAFMFADTICRTFAASLLGLDDVGQLALAIRLGSVATLGATAFSLAWGPLGLGLRPSTNTARVFSRVIVAYCVVAFLASLGVSAVAPELAVVVGGPQFAEAAAAVPGLLLAGAVSGLIYVLVTAAGVSGRGVPVAASSAVGAGVQTAATILLVPSLGVVGFSIAALGGRILTSLWLAAAVSAGIGQASRMIPVLVIGALSGLVVVQLMIAAPANTLLLRVGVLLLALGLAVWVAWRTLLGRHGRGVADRPAV